MECGQAEPILAPGERGKKTRRPNLAAPAFFASRHRAPAQTPAGPPTLPLAHPPASVDVCVSTDIRLPYCATISHLMAARPADLHSHTTQDARRNWAFISLIGMCVEFWIVVAIFLTAQL